MATIAVVINARLESRRLPRKLLDPFAGTSLLEIALEKIDRIDFVAHRYLAVAEDELKRLVTHYPNVELLERRPEAVRQGYHDHRVIWEHYGRVQSDYIFWLNPCSPMLSVDTVKKAVDRVLTTQHNSYTAVCRTRDWIFDENGESVTNKDPGMQSTNHSKQYFRATHCFHVINKQFFVTTGQIWTLTKNDPSLIEMPEEETYDVNTPMEFRIAEAAYIAARR